MTWGTGPWGAGSPWGTGSSALAPTLISVSPSTIDKEGGDVIRILGTNFAAGMEVEFLQGGVVVGDGYIFDARFDIEPTRAWVGTPALDPGTYDIRVTTAGGSTTLAGAVTSALHAEEHRVVSSRSRWAPKWEVGRRYLSGGG